MRPRLIIIQTVLMPYRVPFFSYLKNCLNKNVELYYGYQGFVPSLTSVEENAFKSIKNHYFLGRRLCFQTGMWNAVLKQRTVVVLSLNPRILSHWIILLLRKLVKGKTVLWGHAWPRKGRNSTSDKLRGVMRSLADEIIAYTPLQAAQLKEIYPSKTISSATNALYLKKDIDINFDDTPSNILYVGRLVKEKKIMLLLEAFKNALPDLSEKTSLVIVGKGDREQNLKSYVANNLLQDRILFIGQVDNINQLKRYYKKTYLTIAPGSVGLFLVQSLSFGVPMLIADKEPHGPELEFGTEGKNIDFFKANDVEDLKKKILYIEQHKEKWINKRKAMAIEATNSNTVEAMAIPFIKLAETYGS